MPRKQLLPLFLFFIFITLFVILTENAGLLKPLRVLAEKITLPLRGGIFQTWQGGNQTFQALISWRTNEQKIIKLEKEVKTLQNQTLQMGLLAEENKALRQQLEAPLPASYQFLPAKTLGLVRYLVIDKGEKDKVQVGATVISENILLGKVTAVTPQTSQVLLPIDPDSKIPVRTFKTGARGLVVGEFGTKAVLTKVLQSEILETGDLVVTTGEGGYARDLLLGKIGKISKNEVDPFQKAEVESLLDFAKLENVFLLK